MTWNIVGFTYELWPQVQRYHDENGWVTMVDPRRYLELLADVQDSKR